MKIDSEAIRQLAELLDETGLSEIEVSEGEQGIRVSRAGTVTSTTPAYPAMVSDPTIPQAISGSEESASQNAVSHPGTVTSPMVGTVYMQAEPGTSPFISKGATVNAGDTLLIVEAMKVMNPIKADKDGTVKEIFVENGQPIEFGEALLIIE
jgi:acetyl-CoA carboxylase biotin carboxyl carrier protein